MKRNNLPYGQQLPGAFTTVNSNTIDEMQFVAQQGLAQQLQQPQLQQHQPQQLLQNQRLGQQPTTMQQVNYAVFRLADGSLHLLPTTSLQGNMSTATNQQDTPVQQRSNFSIAQSMNETQSMQAGSGDDEETTSSAVSLLSVHDSVGPQKGIQPSDESDYYGNPPSVQSVVSNDGGITLQELNVTIFIQNGEISAGSEDADKLLSYATTTERQQLKKILLTLAQRKEADISGQRLRNLETALTEDFDNIPVKKLRTYIADFMKVLYMKEADKNKSKIKHIWDNRPSDWPSDVPFIDPNNGTKSVKKPDKPQLKLMFFYLLERYKTWKIESDNNTAMLNETSSICNGGMNNQNESCVSYQPTSDTVPIGGPVVQQQESKVDIDNMEIDDYAGIDMQYGTMQMQELDQIFSSSSEQGSIQLPLSSNELLHTSNLSFLGVDTRHRPQGTVQGDSNEENDAWKQEKLSMLGMQSENLYQVDVKGLTGYSQPVENVDFADITIPNMAEKTESEILEEIAELQLYYGGANWQEYEASLLTQPTETTSDQTQTSFQNQPTSLPFSQLASVGFTMGSLPSGQHPLQPEMVQSVPDDQSSQIPLTVEMAASGTLQSDQAERRAAKRAQQDGKTKRRS